MQAEARARVNLKDLVFSSLEAITDANMQISKNVITIIDEVSDDTGHDEKGNPIWQLKTIQMVYDQLRHEDNHTLRTEKIGLKIPILSLIPLSNLKISKSKIKFATEVQEIDAQDGEVNIYTKVASAESDRSSHSSRIDFEVEMESDPVAEGLARVIDQLSQNFIPKVLQSVPLDPTGNEMSEEEQEQYEMKRELRKQERELANKLTRLNEAIRMSDDKEGLEDSKQQLEQELAGVRSNILEAEIGVTEGEKEDERQEPETPAE